MTTSVSDWSFKMAMRRCGKIWRLLALSLEVVLVLLLSSSSLETTNDCCWVAWTVLGSVNFDEGGLDWVSVARAVAASTRWLRPPMFWDTRRLFMVKLRKRHQRGVFENCLKRQLVRENAISKRHLDRSTWVTWSDTNTNLLNSEYRLGHF